MYFWYWVTPGLFLIMLLLKAGAKPTESSLRYYLLSGTHPEPVVVYGGGFDTTESITDVKTHSR